MGENSKINLVETPQETEVKNVDFTRYNSGENTMPSFKETETKMAEERNKEYERKLAIQKKSDEYNAKFNNEFRNKKLPEYSKWIGTNLESLDELRKELLKPNKMSLFVNNINKEYMLHNVWKGDEDYKDKVAIVAERFGLNDIYEDGELVWKPKFIFDSPQDLGVDVLDPKLNDANELFKKYYDVVNTGVKRDAKYVVDTSEVKAKDTNFFKDIDDRRAIEYFDTAVENIRKAYANQGVYLKSNTANDKYLYTLAIKDYIEQKKDWKDKSNALGEFVKVANDGAIKHSTRDTKTVGTVSIPDITYDKEGLYWKSAKEFANKANEIYSASDFTDGNFMSMLKETGNQITNDDNYLFGILSSLREAQVDKILAKIESNLGENAFDKYMKNPNKAGLTDAENACIQAYMSYLDAESDRYGTTSIWGDSGDLLGQSTAIGLEYIATAGLGGLSSKIFKASKGAFLKYIAKYADGTTKKFVKAMLRSKLPSRAAGVVVEDTRTIGQKAARYAIDLAEGAFNTVVGGTIQGAIQRPVTQAVSASNRHLEKNIAGKYDIKQGDATDIANAYLDGMIEVISERSGGLLNKFLGIGGLTSKMINSNNIAFRTIGRAMNFTNKLAKYTGQHGAIEETFEEVFGEIGRRFTGVHSREEFNRFFTAENFRDMMLGMMVQPFMTGMIGAGVRGVQSRKLNGARQDLTDALGGSYDMEELQNRIKNAETANEMCQIISDVVNSTSIENMARVAELATEYAVRQKNMFTSDEIDEENLIDVTHGIESNGRITSDQLAEAIGFDKESIDRFCKDNNASPTAIWYAMTSDGDSPIKRTLTSTMRTDHELGQMMPFANKKGIVTSAYAMVNDENGASIRRGFIIGNDENGNVNIALQDNEGNYVETNLPADVVTIEREYDLSDENIEATRDGIIQDYVMSQDYRRGDTLQDKNGNVYVVVNNAQGSILLQDTANGNQVSMTYEEFEDGMNNNGALKRSVNIGDRFTSNGTNYMVVRRNSPYNSQQEDADKYVVVEVDSYGNKITRTERDPRTGKKISKTNSNQLDESAILSLKVASQQEEANKEAENEVGEVEVDRNISAENTAKNIVRDFAEINSSTPFADAENKVSNMIKAYNEQYEEYKKKMIGGNEGGVGNRYETEKNKRLAAEALNNYNYFKNVLVEIGKLKANSEMTNGISEEESARAEEGTQETKPTNNNEEKPETEEKKLTEVEKARVLTPQTFVDSMLGDANSAKKSLENNIKSKDKLIKELLKDFQKADIGSRQWNNLSTKIQEQREIKEKYEQMLPEVEAMANKQAEEEARRKEEEKQRKAEEREAERQAKLDEKNRKAEEERISKTSTGGEEDVITPQSIVSQCMALSGNDSEKALEYANRSFDDVKRTRDDITRELNKSFEEEPANVTRHVELGAKRDRLTRYLESYEKAVSMLQDKVNGVDNNDTDMSVTESEDNTNVEMTPEQKIIVDERRAKFQPIAEAIGKRFGVKVEMRDSIADKENGSTVNGWFDHKTNTIVVNLSADEPINFVLGHELNHALKSLGERGGINTTDMYNKFFNAVANTINDFDGEVDRVLSIYTNAGVSITREKAMEEVVANTAGQLMMDGTLFDAIKSDRDLLDAITDILKLMYEAIASLGGSVRQSDIQEALTNLLVAANEEYKKLGVDIINTPLDGVDFSLNVRDLYNFDLTNAEHELIKEFILHLSPSSMRKGRSIMSHGGYVYDFNHAPNMRHHKHNLKDGDGFEIIHKYDLTSINNEDRTDIINVIKKKSEDRIIEVLKSYGYATRMHDGSIIVFKDRNSVQSNDGLDSKQLSEESRLQGDKREGSRNIRESEVTNKQIYSTNNTVTADVKSEGIDYTISNNPFIVERKANSAANIFKTLTLDEIGSDVADYLRNNTPLYKELGDMSDDAVFDFVSKLSEEEYNNLTNGRWYYTPTYKEATNRDDFDNWADEIKTIIKTNLEKDRLTNKEWLKTNAPELVDAIEYNEDAKISPNEVRNQLELGYESGIVGSDVHINTDILNGITNNEKIVDHKQYSISPSHTAEMESIKQNAIANGIFMKAPNGKPTNLNEKQWIQTRTQSFKKWFGDWENDPSNASKVVDENGEPLVVYHGGYSGIDKINTKPSSIKSNKNRASGTETIGFYMTPSVNIANYYSKNAPKENREVYSFFVNMRNPYVDDNKFHIAASLHKMISDKFGDGSFVNPQDIKEHDLEKTLKGHDGLIWDGIEYAIFNPNQAKSATDNNGDFSEDDDIRYSISAPTPKNIAEANTALDNLKQRSVNSTPDVIRITNDMAAEEVLGDLSHIGKPDTNTRPYKTDSFKERASRNFTAPMRTFDMLMRKIGSMSAEGKGGAWNYFMQEWQDSRNLECTRQHGISAIMEAAAEELAGGYSNLVQIGNEYACTIHLDETDHSNPCDARITQAKLAMMYAWSKQEGSEVRFTNSGITQEELNKALASLDPKLKKYVDWVQEKLLPKLWSNYKGLDGTAGIKDYFPFVADKWIYGNKETAKVNEANFIIRWIPSSMLHRNTAEEAEAKKLYFEISENSPNDFFNLLQSRIFSMEKAYCYDQLIENLQNCFGFESDASKAICAKLDMIDPYLVEDIRRASQILVGQNFNATYKNNAAFGFILSNIITNKIAFKGHTAFKQLLSQSTYLEYGDGILKEMAKTAMHPYDTYHWVLENFPMLLDRFKSRELGNVYLGAGGTKFLSQLTESTGEKAWRLMTTEVAKAGLKPNAFFDFMACAMGAKSIFECANRRYLERGYNAEEARRRALFDAVTNVNETQQSREAAYLAPVQLDANTMSKMIIAYNNSSFAWGRKMNQWMRERHKKDDVVRAEFVKKYKDEGFDDATAEQNADKDMLLWKNRKWTTPLAFAFSNVLWQMGYSLPTITAILVGGTLGNNGGDDDDWVSIRRRLVMNLLTGVGNTFTNCVLGGQIFSDIVSSSIESLVMEDEIGYSNLAEKKLDKDMIFNSIQQGYKDFFDAFGEKDATKILFETADIVTELCGGYDMDVMANMITGIQYFASKSMDNSEMTGKDVLYSLFQLANAPEEAKRTIVLSRRDGESEFDYMYRFLSYMSSKHRHSSLDIPAPYEMNIANKKMLYDEIKNNQEANHDNIASRVNSEYDDTGLNNRLKSLTDLVSTSLGNDLAKGVIATNQDKVNSERWINEIDSSIDRNNRKLDTLGKEDAKVFEKEWYFGLPWFDASQ